MVPAWLVIGDSLSFRASNVTSGHTGEPRPDSSLSYKLIDAETREEVVAGELALYDEDAASFEATIGADDLGLYDAEENPAGLVPRREYALRVTSDNDGLVTTKTFVMVALLDPPPQE